MQGNGAFRRGEFRIAVKHYKTAHEIEPELPYYQLNLAAAHLKLSKYVLCPSNFVRPAYRVFEYKLDGS